MDESRADGLTSIKNRPNFIRKSSVTNYSTYISAMLNVRRIRQTISGSVRKSTCIVFAQRLYIGLCAPLLQVDLIAFKDTVLLVIMSI